PVRPRGGRRTGHAREESCPAWSSSHVHRTEKPNEGLRNRLIQGAAMRRVVQSALISLDGVVEDVHSWGRKYFDPAWWKSYAQALEACDALLLGRNTYEMLAEGSVALPLDNAYGRQINGVRKPKGRSISAGRSPGSRRSRRDGCWRGPRRSRRRRRGGAARGRRR